SVTHPHRVDGSPHAGVVRADTGVEVKLPAVPGTVQHPPALEPIAAGSPRLPLPHGAKAERRPHVRATVADRLRLIAVQHDADLATADAGDHGTVPAQLLERRHVVPASAHGVATRSGSRAPNRSEGR